MKGVLFNSSIQIQQIFTTSLETWDPQEWRSSPPISRHPCGAFTHGEFRSHWTWRFRNSQATANLAACGWPETHGDLWIFFGFLEFLGIFVISKKPNSQRLNPPGWVAWITGFSDSPQTTHVATGSTNLGNTPGAMSHQLLATWTCHLL